MKKLKFKEKANQNLFTSKLARIYLSNRDDLDKTETSIAKALLDWAENENKGTCFRTNSDLANDTKISVRTIQRTIKLLVDKNLLVVTKSFDANGKQLGNDYVLLYYKKFMFVDTSEDNKFESIVAVAKRDSLGEGDTMSSPNQEIDINRGDTMTPLPCHHVMGEGDTMSHNDKELMINKKDNVVVVKEIQDFINKNNITFKENLLEEQKNLINEMHIENKEILLDSIEVMIGKTKPFNFLRTTYKNKLRKWLKGEEEKAKKEKEKSVTKEPKQTYKKKSEPKEQTYKKTKFHNFNETFDQYDEDEFNDMVAKSQKEKFGTDKSNPNVSASVMDDLKEAFENPTSHLEPSKDFDNVIALDSFRTTYKERVNNFLHGVTTDIDTDIKDKLLEYK